MLVIQLFLCICRSSCCLRSSRVPSVVVTAIFMYLQYTQEHSCCMLCSTRIRLVLPAQCWPSGVPAAPTTGIELSYEHPHVFGNSDSPQRRLSSGLEPTSPEFRLAAKLGVVSVYVFDHKHFTRNVCVLTIKMSTNIPTVNVRSI